MIDKSKIVLLCLFLLNIIPISATTEITEKPIVIVIPSYNNKNWYEKNLDSVFNQNYENYKVIYIDDASLDGTGQLVERYIKSKNQEHKIKQKITLIKNKKNYGALANIYKAVHTCQDKTIIITLDGDDWLQNNQVLQKINQAYEDKNVWITYGQYEELHYSKKHKKYFTRQGQCKQIQPNIVRAHAYRESEWVSSQLRTFYAGLFKNIKLQDLLAAESFYKVSWDMAFMMPMLEMAQGKFKFIDDILYIYNCINPLNDFKIRLQQQLHISYVIRAKEKYAPLASPFNGNNQNKKADIIIFAQNSRAQLYATLESIEQYMTGIKNIYILHNKKNSKNYEQYETVIKDFENTFLVPANDLKNSLETILKLSNEKYVLLAKDNMIVKAPVCISSCIETMMCTKAHGFYLLLGKNIQKTPALTRKQNIQSHVEIKAGLYAWKFKWTEHDFREPDLLSMAIYNKKDILNSIKDINYNSQESLERYFNKQNFDLEKVGLCFEESKVISIEPENKDKLINLFKNRMKINILPFFFLKNTSTLLKINLSFDEIFK